MSTVDRPAHCAAIVLIFLVEHGPARRNYNQSASHLHHGNRDSKKRKHMRSDGERADQQNEAVDGDAASQQFARLWRVLFGERQKDRTSSDRIYDGKQRAYDQQNALRSLNHSFLYVADTLSKVATIFVSTQA